MNNLFIIPKEINKNESLSPENAYKIGYKDKLDRQEKFPWNSDMEELLIMSREDALIFLNNKFQKYKGLYLLE